MKIDKNRLEIVKINEKFSTYFFIIKIQNGGHFGRQNYYFTQFWRILSNLTVFFLVDIYKSASDDYKEKANEEKIVLYGKEEQCHNPCGFVNDR